MKKQFEIEVGSRKYQVDLGKYTDEALGAFVEQGVKILFQRCTAGMDKNDEAAKAAAEKALAEKLNAGEWKPGASGRTSDPMELEVRAQFAAMFNGKLEKDLDPVKVARDPVKRLETLRNLVQMFASKAGKQITKKQENALVAKNMDRIIEKAREELARKAKAAEEGPVIDLDDL